MKLSNKSTKKFTSAPEGTWRAVCVDVTPLEKKVTNWGEKEIFRLVFEIEEENEEGFRYCVWTKGFVPSLHEKANFRKFLKQWRGRDLTREEEEDFDTETLIGMPAQLVIVHESGDGGEIYANIAACTPYRGNDPLEPSGKFVRKKDRNNEQRNDGESTGYRRAAAPDTEPEKGAPVDDTQAGSDWTRVKVHVGKHAGVELRDLDVEAIQKLHKNWLPVHKQNPKPTADDNRLAAALELAIEEISNAQGDY